MNGVRAVLLEFSPHPRRTVAVFTETTKQHHPSFLKTAAAKGRIRMSHIIKLNISFPPRPCDAAAPRLWAWISTPRLWRILRVCVCLRLVTVKCSCGHSPRGEGSITVPAAFDWAQLRPRRLLWSPPHLPGDPLDVKRSHLHPTHTFALARRYK